jgi:hypothetical protein
LMLGVQVAVAQPKQIVIVRHAEEPRGNSVHLSAKGQRRAEALADFFQTNPVVTRYGLPIALFAARPTPGNSRRSEETLVPTSEALSEPIREPFTKEEYAALAKKILKNPAFKGKTVVIAWTHQYIPKLAAAFGVRPTPKAWKDGTFDRAFVITRSGGEVKLVDLPQRLLPGDSER